VARQAIPVVLGGVRADQAAIWYIRESSVGASRVTNVEYAWPS